MRFRRVLFALLLEEELHICADQGEVKSLPGLPPQASLRMRLSDKQPVTISCRFIAPALNRQNPFHLLRLS